MREAGDERGAVERLELLEMRAVDDPRDDLADIEGLALVGGDDAVEFGGVERGLLAIAPCEPSRGSVDTMLRTIFSACSSSAAR
jgi:hypothetical protein